ncbi:hypothetical protein [Haloechinothrix halophila]|uniref:hypothetical protein n=1 Tax=Haloechinothrix halophila TaxID=1069073 RepID=UPI0012FB1DCE|nr:hypothetical protein [Haloechinothrix halophila]
MLLPSDIAGPATREVGFFETEARNASQWIASIGNRSWHLLPSATLVDLIREVPSAADMRDFARRDLLIPLGSWSALINNSVAGTDVGGLPGVAAEYHGYRGIRAVSSRLSEHPATMLEVYEPGIGAPLNRRRLIYAMSDRGRWSFDTEGEPFDFEETENYSKRRIRDRFTPEMLERYLIALGVPMLESADDPIEGAILVASEG